MLSPLAVRRRGEDGLQETHPSGVHDAGGREGTLGDATGVAAAAAAQVAEALLRLLRL